MEKGIGEWEPVLVEKEIGEWELVLVEEGRGGGLGDWGEMVGFWRGLAVFWRGMGEEEGTGEGREAMFWRGREKKKSDCEVKFRGGRGGFLAMES